MRHARRLPSFVLPILALCASAASAQTFSVQGMLSEERPCEAVLTTLNNGAGQVLATLRLPDRDYPRAEIVVIEARITNSRDAFYTNLGLRDEDWRSGAVVTPGPYAVSAQNIRDAPDGFGCQAWVSWLPRPVPAWNGSVPRERPTRAVPREGIRDLPRQIPGRVRPPQPRPLPRSGGF